jgi:hypothetical protein
MDVAYNPGMTSAGANSVSDWTGGGGFINSLGVMLGGATSDPGQPGSGKPGSITTSPDLISGTGAPSGLKGAFWALVITVGIFALLRKV